MTSLATLLLLTQALAADESSTHPNVLFIAIDDLRPALGCYGDKIAVTPRIDQLASRGTLFTRAYCQQAVCSPSRLSLLTGRRPDTIHVWDLRTHFRKTIPDVVTLPQHFKNHGYHTQSVGKIFHGNGKASRDPPSWSAKPQFDVTQGVKRYATAKNLQGKGHNQSASEAAMVSDNMYMDGMVCDTAIEILGELTVQKSPFFLAVGFRKPHLPFCAPQKYWDLYDRKEILLPAWKDHPRRAPELAVRSWMELEGYTDIPTEGKLSDEKTRELWHGYYACISYTDTLVGRLLDELTRLKLKKNTVILLWSDHGFHLGEQGLWTKANNYELSTRVPLIISAPDSTQRGGVAHGFVELVDIYPTLADLCGLDAPLGVEGISLKPLLMNPEQSWKKAVFSQYPRSQSDNRHQGHGDIMGYAVRTDRYRYIEWKEWKSRQVIARELYDHESDPNEMENLADQALHSESVKKLAQLLANGWKSALP